MRLRIMEKKTKLFILIVGLFSLELIISGIYPNHFFDWVLEVSIPIGVFIILILTYKKFPLTSMAYWLILFHSVILLYGAHYTYAEAPLGEWMREVFGFSRNHYDRIGHIAFGFFPAIIIREIIIRTTPLKRGKMLFFLVVCVVGAAGAFYEIIEWWTAALSNPETGTAFLGSQGDVWDAQWDMYLAIMGALVGQLIFMPLHAKIMIKEGFCGKKKPVSPEDATETHK